jgi:hypothetical protein
MPAFPLSAHASSDVENTSGATALYAMMDPARSGALRHHPNPIDPG